MSLEYILCKELPVLNTGPFYFIHWGCMRWYSPFMINDSGHHRLSILATDSEISPVEHKSQA